MHVFDVVAILKQQTHKRTVILQANSLRNEMIYLSVVSSLVEITVQINHVLC